MDAQTKPNVRSIVPGLITSGLTILAGMEKDGKSFISLDLAYHVALGAPAMGGALACDQGDTLYIALEDTTTSITNRLRLLESNEDVWPLERMSVITSRQAGEMAGLAPVMNEWVSGSEAPAMVIIDTLGTYKALWKKESRFKGVYDSDVALARPFFDFAHEHNIAVVFVHHTNQGKREEQTSWTSRVSGSTGLTGTSDQIIVLDGNRGERDAQLLVTGRNFEDNALTVRRSGPWWHVTDGLPQGRLGDRTMEVEKFVYRSELPVGPADVAAAVDGMTPNQASVYLGRLMQSNRIIRFGRGKYGKPSD